MTEKTDKEKWLELWNLSGEEGERQWRLKQEMHDKTPEANYVIPDIQPYKSMATGEMIMGRGQHKRHLKQHGLIEVGNEPIKEQKRDTYDSNAVKEIIARQIYR